MVPGEARVRSETRDALIANGIPAAYVDEIVELGFGAAERALERLQEHVFAVADERVSITALGVAISIAEMRLDALRSAMINVGDRIGRPAKRFTVGGGHGRGH